MMAASICILIDLHTLLYVETRPPVIWMGKNEYGQVEIWVDGYKNEGGKKGVPKP